MEPGIDYPLSFTVFLRGEDYRGFHAIRRMLAERDLGLPLGALDRTQEHLVPYSYSEGIRFCIRYFLESQRKRYEQETKVKGCPLCGQKRGKKTRIRGGE